MTRLVVVSVDGERRAKLSRGDVMDVTLAPGSHAIEVQLGNAPPETYELVLGDRDEARYACSVHGLFSPKVRVAKVSHISFQERFVKPAQKARKAQAAPEALPAWCRVLGISPEAAQPEIRRAYLRLIKKWHPDAVFHRKRDELAHAEEEARIINSAYSSALKHCRGRTEGTERP